MRQPGRRSLALAGPLVAAAVALLAAGCSSSTPTAGGTPSASATTPAAPTSAAPSSPAASSPAAGGSTTTVTATETEYHIALSTTTYHPGTYKFTATNKGSFPHNLVINGPGVSGVKTPDLLSAGESESVTVTLQKGTYDIFCGVPGHQAKGMDVNITVS
jgi:uncharacterized cupredoxin-like copper-binding protein